MHEVDALTALRERAAEFWRVIASVNRMPDYFPRAQMTSLAGALRTLDRIETEQEKQTLVYAQAKLRKTRPSLRDGFYEMEHALNALFAEIDALLASVPSEEMISLAPSGTEPTQVLQRAAMERKVVALEQRADALAQACHRAIGDSASRVQPGTVRAPLDALLRLAAIIKTELTAPLVDLHWATELIEGVLALSKQLDDAIEGIRPLIARPEQQAPLEVAKGASTRLVAGYKALLRAIRRALARPRA